MKIQMPRNAQFLDPDVHLACLAHCKWVPRPDMRLPEGGRSWLTSLGTISVAIGYPANNRCVQMSRIPGKRTEIARICKNQWAFHLMAMIGNKNWRKKLDGSRNEITQIYLRGNGDQQPSGRSRHHQAWVCQVDVRVQWVEVQIWRNGTILQAAHHLARSKALLFWGDC